MIQFSTELSSNILLIQSPFKFDRIEIDFILIPWEVWAIFVWPWKNGFGKCSLFVLSAKRGKMYAVYTLTSSFYFVYL